MIHIILNNTKKEILKDTSFSILNRPDEYNFLTNREQQYPYIATTMNTKLLKTKAAKDLKTGPKNLCVINFENKVFHKIHISCMLHNYLNH